MNFLLHHHLARRELGPAAAAGAMLPDLWRMADRRMRPRPGGPAGPAGPEAPGDAAPRSDRDGSEDPSADAALRGVLAGIRHHLAVDAWFHASPLLAAGEAATRKRFGGARFAADRMRLLAHVAWELALDGALVRRAGPGALRAEVADDLERSRPAFAAAARLHARDRPPANLGADLGRLVSRLGSSDWIPLYAEAAGLARALEGVRRRVGLAPLPESDHRALAAAFRDLEPEADRSLERILAARDGLPPPER